MGRVRERSSRQVRAGPTPPLYIALSPAPALSRALVSVHTIKYISEKKTDLIIQVKPTIVVDNYSGIDKKDYHIEAEERILEE